LNTYSTSLNFKQGELRQTGNPLDLAIDGQGLFTLRNSVGDLRYTRAGQFEFNADGVLVNRADASKVMARDTNGNLTEIGIAGLRTSAAQASTKVAFTGNLSSSASENTVDGVTVLDAAGSEHALSVKFTDNSATTPGNWDVAVLDGTTTVGTGNITFVDGKPTAETAKINVTYAPAGQTAIPLVFDFTTGVTSFSAGELSTLAASSHDGFKAGALSDLNFDNGGNVVLNYSNGQTAKGPRLALARFDSPDAISTAGDNQFEAVSDLGWHTGFAGDNAFGSVRASVVEISNVDLSQEFSDLVIMQRGYQASSQVISTANDMLQELFTMKGK
jgi:flagellar hook protein FlgE